MSVKKNLFVSIFLLVCSNPIFAQTALSNPYWGNLNITFGGLITSPSTDYHNSSIGTGFNLGVEYFLPLNSYHIVGLELAANKFQVKGEDDRSSITTNQGTQTIPNEFVTSIFSTSLSTFYSYWVSEHIFPFVGIGMAYNVFSPRDAEGEALLNNRKKNYDKEFFNLFGLAGIKVFINDKFSTNFNVKFFNPVTDNLDDIEAGSSNDYYTTFNLGFSYNIFGNEDSDGDGILNKIDLCSEQPEDIDGFQDEDGCPDLDNDGDNIPDLKDVCPNNPEDIDGFQDEDGCPDLDNDGDKIPDEIDLCPNEAEDKDYFQDSDGCPDEDNDNDGILDIVDKCPDSPETFNNFEDEDGCPDSAPVTNKNEDIKQILLESDLIFGSENSTVLPAASEELDRVVEILRNYPEANWRIEGHVDSKGSEQSIRIKSTKQAEAILQYFISKGIDGSKFKVFGMGDKFPIANNTTEFGRQRNRRILIVREQ
ncbi:MAG TPA: OmpA family protein [Ignavibacteriaceae bacterium]|nr:OmpA family protein [Ignavibacteriaceae bacterium]